MRPRGPKPNLSDGFEGAVIPAQSPRAYDFFAIDSLARAELVRRGGGVTACRTRVALGRPAGTMHGDTVGQVFRSGDADLCFDEVRV
jgi:hypothetical protein